MLVSIAMFTSARIELIPRRFFVGEINPPLNVDQFAMIATPLDSIADFQWSSIRVVTVVDKHLKTGGLTFDAALFVFEAFDQHRARQVRG